MQRELLSLLHSKEVLKEKKEGKEKEEIKGEGGAGGEERDLGKRVTNTVTAMGGSRTVPT